MKKGILRQGIWAVITCFLIVLGLTGYASLLNNKLRTEIKMTMQEISEQNKIKLQIEIRSQEMTLLEVTQRIVDTGHLDIKETVSILQDTVGRYPFKRMGIAETDGTAHTTDSVEMNIKDRAYFQTSLKGESAISERLEDYIDGESIIVFSTPVYLKNQVEAVVFATYSTDSLREILNVTAFEGKSHSYIIDAQGDIIVRPGDGVITEKNIYGYMAADPDNQKQIQQLKSEIKEDSTGYIHLYTGTDHYMQYTPLEKNGWYLLNMIPANSMDTAKNYIMGITYLLCGGIALLFGGLLVYIGRLDKKKNQQLEHILYVDSVTGDHSYQYFCDKGQEILTQTDRKAACIVMDIEDFKLVNELFGHKKGDEMLCHIARLWKEWLQEGELYGRRIADRFVVLAFYEEKDEFIQRVEQFIENIGNTKIDGWGGYVLHPKLGIYYVEDNSDDIQKIQNYAVMAYSTVKKEQAMTYAVYDDTFKNQMLEQKIMEDKMAQAYIEEEFIVYFQPKYDAVTRELAGAEALIRWKKTDGTLIPPFRFIPVAEKSGFVIKLDQYIFSQVCRQQKMWREKGKELVPISVNLSREHLKGEDFIQQYWDIWKESQIPIESIELEITESAIFENQGEFKEIVDKLHALGFRILMDDFGTGYSSLMMLKTIPIDVMKLDKSFVDDYRDPRGQKIISCVVQLAKNMDISVTAEGVETEEQYEFMKQLGCNQIQGYYFAKPMPAEEFEELLKGTSAE